MQTKGETKQNGTLGKSTQYKERNRETEKKRERDSVGEKERESE